MYGLSVLLLAALLWILRELIVGTQTWWRRFDTRYRKRVEETQRHFAEARNQLMEAAIGGNIDVDSEAFKLFYGINTAFMRRPDQYEEISKALTTISVLDEDPESAEAMRVEVEDLSPEALDALRRTGDALGHLVIDYSFLLKNAYRLMKRSNPDLTYRELLVELSKEASPKKKADLEDKIERAQDDIYNLLPSNRAHGRSKFPAHTAPV